LQLNSNVNTTMHTRSCIKVGWMPLTYSKLYHMSVTVPQDNGRAKRMVGPTYLTLVRASTQLPIVFPHPWLLFISYACLTLNILCLLWNVNSTVRNVSVGGCFVLGWWVQCHVLCQQSCCACWSWWNTQSYEACCYTGDTRLGSVNYTMKTYLMQSFPKFFGKTDAGEF